MWKPRRAAAAAAVDSRAATILLVAAAAAAAVAASCCTTATACCCWLLLIVEIGFWHYFHAVLVPQANERRPTAASYRAPYHTHKHLLLRRIIHRIRTADADFADDATIIPTALSPDHAPASSSAAAAAADDDDDDAQLLLLQARFSTFLTSWFYPVPLSVVEKETAKKRHCNSSKKLRKQTSSSSTVPSAVRVLTKGVSSTVSSNSSDDSGSVSSTEQGAPRSARSKAVAAAAAAAATTCWTIPGLYKPEMDDFLAWAMFAKEMNDMDAAELEEMGRCYKELYDTLHLTFLEQPCSISSSSLSTSLDGADNKSGSMMMMTTHKLVPRRLSLEDVRPWHRPLAVYALVYFLSECVTGVILRLAGFGRVVSPSTGLKGWYRPAAAAAASQKPGATSACHSNNKRMPLVFFHGIAPAGVLFYVPMLLFGLLTKDQPCLLVDNPNISCSLNAFDALTEQETVRGVQELIEACCFWSKDVDDSMGHKAQSLTVCGHSFGSCPISWLLHDADFFRDRIRLCVLMDPVTVLLSDPAVMINFLYSRGLSTVRMIASSELFTEYYLRRHFSWYNSELWLDEVLSESIHGNNHAIIVVALSEKDEIVDAPKVKRHADMFVAERQNGHNNNNNTANRRRRLRTVYWKDARHASCVTDPRKWRDLHSVMLQSELELLLQQQQQ